MKALGAVEILSTIGLTLPALLDIVLILVLLATVGLALIMAGAAIVTFRYHEFKHVLLNLTYLALLLSSHGAVLVNDRRNLSRTSRLMRLAQTTPLFLVLWFG